MNILTRLCTGALLLGALGMTGCPDKGGAFEKAGDEIVDALEKVGDTLDDDGPLENAGEKIDDAVDDIKE